MKQLPNASRFAPLRSLLQIEAGEGQPVALLFALACLLALAVVFVQAMAFGLFVGEFGAQGLPFAYVSIAVLASAIAVAYLKLAGRWTLAALLSSSLLFMGAGCVVFWMGLVSPLARGFVFLLPLWFQVLSNLCHLALWPLAGRIFDVRQGKRLFALIGAGFWSANIIGGFIVPPLSGLFGAHNLLLCAAVSLGIALGCLRRITRAHLAERAQRVARTRPPRVLPAASLLNNRYVVSIYLYVVLWWIAFFFVETIFFERASAQYPDANQLTAYTGLLIAAIGVVALVMTTFVNSRVITRFGVRAGITAEPVIVTAAIGALALAGIVGGTASFLFWLAALAKVTSVALGFSLSQLATLIVYQPLAGDRRVRVQTMAEGIMQPLATGAAGLGLLLLTAILQFGAVGLAWVFLLVGASWIASALWLSRLYPQTLANALTKWQIGDSPRSFIDHDSVALLHAGLHSPHPAVVIYALDQLQQIDHSSLAAVVHDLMAHPTPDIRREAYRRAEQLQLTPVADALHAQLAREDDPTAREAALRALLAIDPQGGFSLAIDALDEADPAARRGALIGLLRYGGIDGVLAAGQTFNHLVGSPVAADRILAAQVIEHVSVSQFYMPVLTLLRDHDPLVQRAALQTAGHIKHPRLWTAVLAACQAANPATARAAVAALSAGGESALDAIAEAFARADTAATTVIRLVHVCRRVGGEHALQLLQSKVVTTDVELRSAVLHALAACGYRARDCAFVQQHIRHEIAHAAWIAATLNELADDQRSLPLTSALQTTLQQTRERVVCWLSFVYDAQAIRRAGAALAHAAHQAHALEVIDTQLPAHLKSIVMPLMEDLPPAARLARWSGGFPQLPQTLSERVRTMIAGTQAPRFSAWSRACALHAVGQLGLRDCANAVVGGLEDPNPRVREAAQRAQLRLDASAMNGAQAMLSTIEKVLVLKLVSMFSEVPHEVLADVADVLEEQELAADETIFHKGELGDSLYIIIAGRVCVRDGDRLVNYLGEYDVFGEMALLDPEPRSATVTTVDPTLVFRLAQASFYELIDERPDVVKGVLRVLTKRLRDRMSDLAQLSARVDELESAATAGKD